MSEKVDRRGNKGWSTKAKNGSRGAGRPRKNPNEIKKTRNFRASDEEYEAIKDLLAKMRAQ